MNLMDEYRVFLNACFRDGDLPATRASFADWRAGRVEHAAAEEKAAVRERRKLLSPPWAKQERGRVPAPRPPDLLRPVRMCVTWGCKGLAGYPFPRPEPGTFSDEWVSSRPKADAAKAEAARVHAEREAAAEKRRVADQRAAMGESADDTE